MSTHTWTSEGERYEASRSDGLLELRRAGMLMRDHPERPTGLYPWKAEAAVLSELLSLAERLAEVEERERWIPVEERLPDTCREVVAWRRWPSAPGGWWESARYYGAEGQGWSCAAGAPVTHWRELPPGPK